MQKEPGVFTKKSKFPDGYLHHDHLGKNHFLLISMYTSPPEIKRFGFYFVYTFYLSNTERC